MKRPGEIARAIVDTAEIIGGILLMGVVFFAGLLMLAASALLALAGSVLGGVAALPSVLVDRIRGGGA